MCPKACSQCQPFQSTPPVKAATLSHISRGFQSSFQSTPPVKAATQRSSRVRFAVVFQSTPPVKAATMSPLTLFASVSVFQSTPPVKAATCIHSEGSYGNGISIHAAREGGDPARRHPERPAGFQSTPPVKAATMQSLSLPPL